MPYLIKHIQALADAKLFKYDRRSAGAPSGRYTVYADTDGRHAVYLYDTGVWEYHDEADEEKDAPADPLIRGVTLGGLKWVLAGLRAEVAQQIKK